MHAPKPQIIVAGDVAIDWIGVRVPALARREDTHNWLLKDSAPAAPRLGGAYLLARYVRLACGDRFDVLGPDEPGDTITNVPPSRVLHSMITVAEDPKDHVFRVATLEGFAGPVIGSPVPVGCSGNRPDAEIVVIDDVGNGFRDGAHESAWPLAIGRPGATPQVIYKMGAPLVTGQLWKTTVAHHGERMTVIIDADELRGLGAHVSRRLSWERTAEDTAHHLERDHRLADLRRCAHVIVRFGIDGALHSERHGDTWRHRLFFDPERAEGGFASTLAGTMIGYADAFTAALVGTLCRPDVEDAPDSPTLRLADGIRNGIHAARRLLLIGFGTRKDARETRAPTGTHDRRLPALDLGLCTDNRRTSSTEGLEIDHSAQIFSAGTSPGGATSVELKTGLVQDVLLPGDRPERDGSNGAQGWTILQAWHVDRPEHVPYDIVLRGLAAAPGLPRAQFAKFITVDRSEIESFRAISNLIREYLRRPTVSRPLCIAVFGQPGSGKSFGVKQVATSLGGVKDVTYNVAQFTTERSLVDAFHEVRDVKIEDAVPLVFFDEFDCKDLDWLSQFLEPMQDGVFTDSGRRHPIGKAIFVFAGGTSHTHQAFVEAGERLTRKKVPDFISRLRGFVNIAGPNPTGPEQAGPDAAYRLRRAVMLRSMLERAGLGSEGCVDPGIVRAMIDVSSYEHGVRSMEAILDMSLLTETNQFEQAAVPSAEQLGMHVDAAEFYRLMHSPTPIWDRREELAKAIHRKFQSDHANDQKADPKKLVDWDQLAERFRDSNRQQADFIPSQLDAIGCQIAFGPESDSISGFTPPQLSCLAEREHERWEAERRLSGWTFGRRDTDGKVHPNLLPWKDLTDEIQGYDRHAVEFIPELLQSQRLYIQPKPRK